MTNVNITFAQGWPMSFVLVVTAAALASVYWFYKRTAGVVPRKELQRLVLLRAVAMVILLLCLFRPVVSFQKTLTRHSSLLVLLDTSQSMSIRDFPNLPDRLDRATSALLQEHSVLRSIEKDFEVTWYAFDSSLRKLDGKRQLRKLKAEGDSTALAHALKAVIEQKERGNIAGVVAFTDGIDNSGQDVVRTVQTLGVPIYPVGVGSRLLQQKGFRDIVITKVESPRSVSVKNVTQIKVFVEAFGYADRVVPVILKREGVEVAREKLVLDNRKSNQRVVIKYTPTQTGQFQFEVSIPVDPSERIQENNVNSFPLLVTDPKIRVLYIEGTLRWEYKFLRRTLQQDPNVELLSLIKTGEDAFYQQDHIADIKLNGFPRDKETIRKFDVVIVGDIDRSYFNQKQMESIRDAVKEGTGFVMLGGYHSFGPGGYTGTPIEQILPVTCGGRDIGQEKEPFEMKLTPEGQIHPIFAGCEQFFSASGVGASNVVPRLLGCVVVKRAKPGASVLAIDPLRKNEFGNLIVLAVQTYGEGRAAALTVDTTWKWQFQLRAMGRQSPYVKFWGQLIRWLANREKTEKEAKAGITAFTDKNYYEPGEHVRIMARVTDEQGQTTNEAYVLASIEGKKGKPSRVQIPYTPGSNGEYEAEFVPPEPGAYKGEVTAKLKGNVLGKAKLRFQFGKSNLEFEKLDLNEETLKKLADLTGGKYCTLISLDRLASSLQRTLRTRTLYREIDFWNSSVMGISPSVYVFIAFILLITIEWLSRKRWHLS